MLLSLLDIYTWAIVCLTPHVAVATSTAPQVQLHFTTVRQSISGFTIILFWMVEEVNLLYSLAFLAGLVYWIRRPDRALLTLYLTIFGTLLTLTVLIVPVTNRYCSALYPLLVAGAMVSADALLRELAARFSLLGSTTLPVDRRWRTLMAGLLLLACLLNCEFNKVVGSYDRLRFMDHHAAVEFIDRNKKPGDKVMSVRPPASAIILKGVDFYAMVNIHFDEIYMRRHGLTDRFAGGLLVWKLDQLRKVFLENDRIWIVLDERRGRALSGPMAAFIAHSCSVEYEFFGGQVLLWERKAGRYHTGPSRGGEDDSF